MTLQGHWPLTDDTQTATDGVSRYALDGDATDSWGSNDGAVNGASVTGDAIRGQAYSFDGVDDWIDTNISTSAINDFVFTFSCWFKHPSTNNYPSLFGKRGAGDVSRAPRVGIQNDNTFRVAWGDSGDNENVVTSAGTNFTVANNSWHHMTLVCDRPNNTTQLFINGTLADSNTWSSTTPRTYSGSVPIGILTDSGGSLIGDHWNGNIDEVRIYDYALSPQEVSDLYNWGRTFDYSGNESHGDLRGVTQGVSGILNTTTYSFDGGNYINIGNPSNIGLSLSDFSISMWINTDDSTNEQWFFGNYDGSNGGAALIINRSETNGISLYDGISGNTFNSHNISSNTWIYVTLTRKSSSNYELFLDGEYFGSVSTSETLFTNSSDPMKIAGGYTSSWFIGEIDEVRTYNHALTPHEIQYLHQVSQQGSFVTEQVTIPEQPTQFEAQATVPSGTSIDVTVENASGVTETVSVEDGETTALLSNFNTAGDYWLSAELTTTNIENASSIDYIALIAPSSNAFVYDGSSWDRTDSINVYDGSSWNEISKITEM